MRELSDVRAVINELGGMSVVADLTGRSSPKTISNWIAGNKFPAWTYFDIQAELKKQDATAPIGLWRWSRRAKG